MKTEHFLRVPETHIFSRAHMCRNASSTHMRWPKNVWSVCLCASIRGHPFVSCVHFLVFQIHSLRFLPHQPSLLQAGMSANTWADPRGGLLFGRMAEQGLLRGHEPKSLIEVSSEHTPIDFSSRKNSFNTDVNDLATTVAASEIAETLEVEELTSPLFTQEREVSANLFGVSDFQQAGARGSQQQPASSSVLIPRQETDLGSSGKPVRGNESFSIVERSLFRGKRDRDFEIVQLCLNMKETEFCLKGKTFMNTLKRRLNELYEENV